MCVLTKEFKLTEESHASKNVRTRLFLEKKRIMFVFFFNEGVIFDMHDNPPL